MLNDAHNSFVKVVLKNIFPIFTFHSINHYEKAFHPFENTIKHVVYVSSLLEVFASCFYTRQKKMHLNVKKKLLNERN